MKYKIHIESVPSANISTILSAGAVFANLDNIAFSKILDS